VEVEEDLLGDVFGSIRITQHPPGDRGDLRVLLVEQPVEARRPHPHLGRTGDARQQLTSEGGDGGELDHIM
jgi:hypothetical protein